MKVTQGIFATFLTISLIFAGCGGKSTRKHYEKDGDFSYDPPAGWEIVELGYLLSSGSPYML